MLYRSDATTYHVGPSAQSRNSDNRKPLAAIDHRRPSLVDLLMGSEIQLASILVGVLTVASGLGMVCMEGHPLVGAASLTISGLALAWSTVLDVAALRAASAAALVLSACAVMGWAVPAGEWPTAAYAAGTAGVAALCLVRASADQAPSSRTESSVDPDHQPV